MQIISFALTTSALLAQAKSVTRRDWPDKYAAQFKLGALVQAYDKSPRNGGKCVAVIRLEDKRREPLSALLDDPAYGREELVKEGNLWNCVEDFLAIFGNLRHGDPVRLAFTVVEIKGQQVQIAFRDPVLTVHAEFCKLTGQQLRLPLFQTFWKELLHTQGFTPDDVAVTARYLMRQIKKGQRQEGCLKIFNFANPVQFASDLALARKVIAHRVERPEKPQPIVVNMESQDEIRRTTAAGLAAFRASQRRERQ